MAVNERQESSMLEAFPVKLLTHTLEYLDIVGRVKLAGTNQTLQRRVYRECKKAWKIINFFFVKDEISKRLTDFDLSRLLTRVNAIKVTKALGLHGCSLIRGNGLLPLRNSRVLDTMHLLGAQEVQTHPTFVMQVLRSMFSFNLIHVVFPTSYMRNPDDVLISFMRDFRESNLDKAKRNPEWFKCMACNLPLADATLQLPPTFIGHPSFTCDFSCSRLLCRRGTCVASIRECCLCRVTSCDSCGGVCQCDSCGYSYCGLCRDYYDCDDCQDVSCGDCGKECSRCNVHLCIECAQTPDSCGNDCSLCHSCARLGVCSSCNNDFCIGCTEGAKQCAACSNVFCTETECVERVFDCSTCDATFCRDCKESDQCNACNTTFCATHNRMVDCKACGTRHCRSCGYKNQCQYCQTACYEECVCGNEKPAKRAKLS